MVKSSISKSAKSSSSVVGQQHDDTSPKHAYHRYKAKPATASLCNFAPPKRKSPVVDVDSVSSLSSFQTRRKLSARRRRIDEESSSANNSTEPDYSPILGTAESASSIVESPEFVGRKISTISGWQQSPADVKKPKIEENTSSGSSDEEQNTTTDLEENSSAKYSPPPKMASESPKIVVVPSSQFSSSTNCDEKESKITFFALTPGHLRSLFNQLKKLQQCFEEHYEKKWTGVDDFDEFCQSTRNFQNVISETEKFVKDFFENPPIFECSSMEEFYERHYKLQEQIELEELQNEILTETAECLQQLSSDENLLL